MIILFKNFDARAKQLWRWRICWFKGVNNEIFFNFGKRRVDCLWPTLSLKSLVLKGNRDWRIFVETVCPWDWRPWWGSFSELLFKIICQQLINDLTYSIKVGSQTIFYFLFQKTSYAHNTNLVIGKYIEAHHFTHLHIRFSPIDMWPTKILIISTILASLYIFFQNLY